MPRRPNVLFMIADDHRHDAIGALGDPVVRTPTMDELAARGVVFSHHYTQGGLTGAVCIPSRAQVLTGAGPFRSAGSERIDDTAGLARIPTECTLLPELFRRAGYQTHGIGKWHNDRASFARGFASAERVFFGGMSDHDAVPLHDFDPTGRYDDAAGYVGQGFSTELFCDAAIRFLEGRSDDTPFFLYLSFTSPHDPRTPPGEYASMYDPAAMPLPPNFATEHPFDNGDMRVRDELLAAVPRDPDEVRQHIADYYGMISHQDAWMGRVLAALAQSGQADDTIVVYTVDHGLSVGRHGLMGKQNLYDHSVRVPLMVRGPSLPRGGRVDAPTCHADLLPTLCELADVSRSGPIDGASLTSALGGGAGPHAVVCAVYKDVQRMASDGRWKLIRYYRGGNGAGTDRVQLFDIGEDPHETRDRSGDPGARSHLDRLAGALADWQGAAGDPWADRPVLPA